MGCCDSDFIFPMQIDIYYPQVEQNMYGQITKDWSFDRTIVGSLNPDTISKEDIPAEAFVHWKDRLVGRVKSDPRISSTGEKYSTTNILLLNIRNSYGDPIYIETSGEREGRGTIYEIMAIDPFVGPFGDIEFYNIIIRRTENQGVDD